MGANKTLFLKMQEDEFLSIPKEIRSIYLTDKVYTESANDHAENMQDALYSQYYTAKKEASKQLDERQYQLREERRKQLKTNK